MLNPASTAVNVGFVAVVLAVAGAVVWAAARAGAGGGKRAALVAALGMGAWLAISAALAWSGVLGRFDRAPPMLARMVMLCFVATILLARSRAGGRLAAAAGVPALIGVQVFRLPVELVLFALHREGIAPVQVTFEGLNYDVLTGVSAIAIAVLAARRALPRWALLAWNVAGIALLLTIVVVANLSEPGAFRAFHEGPAFTIITTAPFVWLPSFLVPFALFGHLLAIRLLREESRAPVAMQTA